MASSCTRSAAGVRSASTSRRVLSRKRRDAVFGVAQDREVLGGREVGPVELGHGAQAGRHLLLEVVAGGQQLLLGDPFGGGGDRRGRGRAASGWRRMTLKRAGVGGVAARPRRPARGRRRRATLRPERSWRLAPRRRRRGFAGGARRPGRGRRRRRCRAAGSKSERAISRPPRALCRLACDQRDVGVAREGQLEHLEQAQPFAGDGRRGSRSWARAAGAGAIQSAPVQSPPELCGPERESVKLTPKRCRCGGCDWPERPCAMGNPP